MIILYLTFGKNTEYHVQAYLSMLSFRRQMRDYDRLVVVTNVPEFYNHVREWAEIVTINDRQVQEWKGKHQYMFRVKTMVIKQQAEAFPESHLLFVDTDTLLYGNLEGIRTKLDEGVGLLHRNEGHPSKMKGASHKMWKRVEGRTYNGITLSEKHVMWNSGIIGMPKGQTRQITNDTLLLLDCMLNDGVKSFNVEQYAMSIAMTEHVPLVEGHQYVAHYWAVKDQWFQAGMELMARVLLTDASLEEEMQMYEALDFSQLPVFVHKSNTARRLKGLIGRLFRDRNFKYIQKRT